MKEKIKLIAVRISKKLNVKYAPILASFFAIMYFIFFTLDEKKIASLFLIALSFQLFKVAVMVLKKKPRVN